MQVEEEDRRRRMEDARKWEEEEEKRRKEKRLLWKAKEKTLRHEKETQWLQQVNDTCLDKLDKLDSYLLFL